MSRYDNNGMTYRERDVYKYIQQFQQKHGYAPTIEEISQALITSRSYVRYAIHRLEFKGWVLYDETKRRSIVVVKHDETATTA